LLLDLLRDAGSRGVSVLDLIHKHNILRASGRILELRRAGYVIETRMGPGGTAIYVLISEPPAAKPSTPSKRSPNLPLFAGVLAEVRE
jgi:hypothetical protein